VVPGLHSALQTISTLKHPCLDLGSISIAPSSLSRTKGLGQLTHGSLFFYLGYCTILDTDMGSGDP
jgi:hypothetical protein